MTRNIVGTFTITQTVEVPQGLVDDLICTAFEGGCAEWIDRINVINKPADIAYSSDALTRGGHYVFAIDGEKHELDINKFVKGIEMFCECTGKTVDDLGEDHDAGDADMIMQYALFEEYRYG